MTPSYPVGRNLEGESVFTDPHPKQGVFMPRIEKGRLEELTASIAVMRRTRRPDTFTQFEPQDSRARNTLDSAGLLSSLGELGNPISSGKWKEDAVIKPLKSVGMIAAQFFDRGAEEEIVESLDKDYEFVPDFDLAMPSPLELNAQRKSGQGLVIDPSEQGQDHWMEESGVTAAHNDDIKGQGVLMGVLDTGVDIDHGNFRRGTRPNKNVPFTYIPLRRTDQIQEVRGFDPDGHGTHVCGIIAGRKTGVAPKSTLCVASVIESETTKTSFMRVISGLNWLLGKFLDDVHRKRPAIINMSLGFPAACPPDMKAADYAAAEKLLALTIDQLYRANVLVVGAIGNDGEGRYRLPAAYDQVLGVGAVDYDKNVASFSGSGAMGNGKPDVAGYGVDVLSSWPRTPQNDSPYVRLSGTSMASPYVAGIAALYWCRNQRMTSWEIRKLVMDKARPVNQTSSNQAGEGLACFVK